MIAETKVGALFIQFILVLLPSIIATPYLYRRLKTGKAISKVEVRTSCERLLSFSIAGAIGLAVGVPVSYVLFVFPSWVWGPESMIFFSLISGLPAFLAGCVCFVWITRRLGPLFLGLLFPMHISRLKDD